MKKTKKECVYCQGDVDDRAYLMKLGKDGIYISGNNELIVDDGLDWDDLEIRFCPMCGRRLNL